MSKCVALTGKNEPFFTSVWWNPYYEMGTNAAFSACPILPVEQRLHCWHAYFPSAFAQCWNLSVFSLFSPWFMLLWDHTDDSTLALSHCFEGLNVAGTGCCLMTVFTVYWLSGSARAPHWGLVWTIWMACPSKKEGERVGLVLGCFCLRRRKGSEGHPLKQSPSAVQVFVVSAVQFRLDSSHCCITSFAFSVMSFR